MPVLNLSHLEELQFLGPNLPKKHFRVRNLKIIYFKQKIL